MAALGQRVDPPGWAGRGGRLAVATNGADHLAELNTITAAVGRPDLAIGTAMRSFPAETRPAQVARFCTEVIVERYPDELAVPAAEPILAYLTSLTETPLTPQQQHAAREMIQARIDHDGSFRIGKHTVLITAVR